MNRKFILESGAFLIFFIYILLRAIRIPVTHDEAGSILNFSVQPVWDILTYKDPIPNNHILNTLFIKFFTSLFGFEEWICRLPNIIAGGLYFIYGVRIGQRLFPSDRWMQVLSLIFLLANPYLIEFFSLARGYGLSIGLMIISIFYLIRNEKNDLTISVLFGGCSVYANLTLLNYFIPLIALLGIRSSLQRPIDWKLIKSMFLILSGLTLLLIVPVFKMINTNQFQFWHSHGFYQDTFSPLLHSSLQGKQYLGKITENIFSVLILSAVTLIIMGWIFYFIRKRFTVFYTIPVVFIFIGSVGYNLLQNHLFNIPYLNARTSLFYYPLFVISMLSLIAGLSTSYGILILKKAYMVMGVFCLMHMIRCYNVKSSYEWWFDADNKTVLDLIEKDQTSVAEKVTFKCNWLFQPSMTYYTRTQKHDRIYPPPYNKSIDSSEIVDYYLITSDDRSPWIMEHYDVFKAFAWDTRFLMKKKPMQ